jgi:cyclophilin family peptidyl-prolyl cis-trans isomerase
MNRIGTICVAGLAAAMLFAGGCWERSQSPQSSGSGPAPARIKAKTNPVVVIETSMGVIKAELWSDTAPVTVKNFLAYVDDKHFDGLIFHRVVQGFMIQGGGFDPEMKEKPCRDPIKNEASADKKNDRGTLAMARTPVLDSATSQFYINLVDNDGLNHRDETFEGFGYCAFGKVISGMDVVDKIGAVEVGFAAGRPNVPTSTVLIKSIRRGK